MKLKHAGYVGALGLTFGLAACGNHTEGIVPPPPSGIVTQQPITGATVYADHLSGSEANLKMDADEAATLTTTDASGHFALPVTPSYPYRIVSQGGTDSVTGQPAMQMIAPAGARNISPLTTLVALDNTGKVQALIQSLGVNYDDNISAAITPAAALLVKSVEAAVSSVTNALNTGGNTLSINQVNLIQQIVVQNISNQLQTATTTGVTTPATLTATLQTAAAGAVTSIANAGPTSALSGVLTINNGDSATTIANAAVPASLVTTIATDIGSTSTSPSSAVTEATLVTPSEATAINFAATTAAASAATQVTVTNPAYVAPTISGTPAATVVAGAAYDFIPTITNASGDTLSFTIQNRPSWAKLNPLTGELSGTAPATAATYGNIIITVTDGITTTSSPAFSITVTTATGGTGGSGGTGTGTGF